jgi:hypothetical protein
MFNNHDFDTTTEAKKVHFWHVADMGGLVAGRRPIGRALEGLLRDPPCRKSPTCRLFLVGALRIRLHASYTGVSAQSAAPQYAALNSHFGSSGSPGRDR